MSDGAEYLLPAGTAPAAAAKLLTERLGAAAEPARPFSRTYYDTFDGRLRAAGMALVHAGGALRLDALAAPERRGPPERLLVADLPAGALRDRLAGVAEMRALLPTARLRGRERALRVLDGER